MHCEDETLHKCLTALRHTTTTTIQLSSVTWMSGSLTNKCICLTSNSSNYRVRSFPYIQNPQLYHLQDRMHYMSI